MINDATGSYFGDAAADANYAAIGVAAEIDGFAVASAGKAARASADANEYAWDSLRADCRAIESGTNPLSEALWIYTSPLIEVWSTIRTHPSTQTPGWRFWIDWYDRALTGQPQDWLLLEKIALIDPTDWDKGEDHVNALIAEIRLKHLAETRSLGEDAIDKGKDGRWRRAARSDIDRDILQDACDRVKDTIKRIRKAMERGNNAFNALSDDLDHLESALRRYKDRPLRLHDEFLRVQRHIARDLKSGELPDDHLVDDLNTDLGTAALDMRNACPKTAKVVADRASARFAELDERERVAVVQIAEAAATLSDEDLAGEFREDAVEAVATEGDPQDKAPARYRLSTRLAVIATRDGKNIVDALILMGALKAGIEAYSMIVLAILSLIL